MTNVTAFSNGELLSLYDGLLVELRRRNLVRSAFNPVADYGEQLFCAAMGWQREHHQGQDYDATTREGARVKIKARRLNRASPPIRSGSIHDKDGFDLIALALFDSEFRVEEAVVIPREIALRHLRWSQRQKAWYVSLSKAFWAEPDLDNVTAQLEMHSRRLLAQG